MGSHALDAKLATVEHSRRRSAPLRSYVLGAQHTATKRRARQRLRSPRAGDGEALQPRSSPCSFAPIIAFVARQLAIYLHRAVPGGFASLYRCVGSTCITTGRAPIQGSAVFLTSRLMRTLAPCAREEEIRGLGVCHLRAGRPGV